MPIRLGQLISSVLITLLLGVPLGYVLLEAIAGPQPGEMYLSVDYERSALGMNTFTLVSLTLMISLPIGVIAGLLLFRTDIPGRTVLIPLFLAAMLVPLDLQATAWIAYSGPGGLLTTLGIPIRFEGMAAAAWIHAMAMIPWVTLITGLLSLMVEPQFEEMSLIEIGPVRTLATITLRRIAGGLAAAALLIAAMTAGEMAVTDLLRVRTFAETVYTEFALAGLSGAAMRSAIPGMAVSAVILIPALWIVTRFVPAARRVVWGRLVQFKLGTHRLPAFLWTAATILLCLGIPVLSLVWHAGLGTRTIGEGAETSIVSHWSVQLLWQNMVESVRVTQKEILFSSLLAILTAGCTGCLGITLAWLARCSRSMTFLLATSTIVLLALPGPVIGAGVALTSRSLADRGDLLTDLMASPLPLIWVLILRTLAIANIMMWAGFRLVERELIDTARVDGLSWWDQLWRIAVPRSRPALAATCMIVIIMSLGELSGSVIVAPAGTQPLSHRIFTLAHNGVENYLAGICLVLLSLTSIGAIVTFALVRNFARMTEE